MDRVAAVGSQVVPCEVAVGIDAAVVASSVASETIDRAVQGHQIVDQGLPVVGNHQVVGIHMDSPVGVSIVADYLGLGLAVVQGVVPVVLDVAAPVELVADTSSAVVPDTAASNTGNIACTERIVVGSFLRKGFVQQPSPVVFLVVGCRCLRLKWLRDDCCYPTHHLYWHLYPTSTSRWILEDHFHFPSLLQWRLQHVNHTL